MDSICGRCGRTIPDFARVCEHCGDVIMDSRFSILGLTIDTGRAPAPAQSDFDFSPGPEVKPAPEPVIEPLVLERGPDEEEVEAPVAVAAVEPSPPIVTEVGPPVVRPDVVVPSSVDDTRPIAPAHAPEEADEISARRTSNRVIVSVALACVVSAAITFGVLVARSAPSAALAASPAGGIAPAAAVRAPSDETAAWTSANSRTWAGRERNTVAFEVQAENTVGVWMRTVRPSLVVRCASGSVEAFVFTASAARIEPQTDDHTVKVRFDGTRPATEHWRDSEEHDALFAPDGDAFVQRILASRRFSFEFTPHNAAQVTVRFQVGGLRPHLEAAARSCGKVK